MLRTAEMSDERLEWHLQNWAKWQFRDDEELRKLWYPDHSPVILSGVSVGVDGSQLLYDEADARAAESMDAIIDSLSIHHRCAVQNKWLACVWKGRDIEAAYDEARQEIKKIAAKRGLI